VNKTLFTMLRVHQAVVTPESIQKVNETLFMNVYMFTRAQRIPSWKQLMTKTSALSMTVKRVSAH
jgi:hypothetical protein